MSEEDFNEFDLPVQEPEASSLAGEDRRAALRDALVPASMLEDPDDIDMGDYGPGRTYKSFAILAEPPLDVPETHARFHDGFYVRSPRGMLGFVPWPGSMVVWETELAWEQDLFRPEVHTLLKEDEKKKAPKK